MSDKIKEGIKRGVVSLISEFCESKGMEYREEEGEYFKEWELGLYEKRSITVSLSGVRVDFLAEGECDFGKWVQLPTLFEFKTLGEMKNFLILAYDNLVIEGQN